MDSLFKALGDNNRLRILNLLRKGELCVCEIEVILDTTQSNVSRHLGKLRNEGIITYEKKAQWIHYRIDPQFIEENKLLYHFINEKMDENNKFLMDLTKLTKYKKSAFTCENLKEMSEIIFS
ncbi:regulatory protein, ArsR [Alkaliphilus metalliredigens QYMF]|uniref:Regulatory protein, ArsR n=1 Tax=Alkaliphilus metalliredigens (strain QYMF) TaxID=293826 RepID=A6TP79_ALKMQ|nr:metalloregulator ArsR/SmtB family transcription factor [Alkaliphilus metalliredigens]ABR47997.1 regulatory protein, ArsR [Alkaliphilus metalliredigens QYMF]